jgi:hypothetical protein
MNWPTPAKKVKDHHRRQSAKNKSYDKSVPGKDEGRGNCHLMNNCCKLGVG